jgi:hypothetical protein
MSKLWKTLPCLEMLSQEDYYEVTRDMLYIVDHLSTITESLIESSECQYDFKKWIQRTNRMEFRGMERSWPTSTPATVEELGKTIVVFMQSIRIYIRFCYKILNVLEGSDTDSDENNIRVDDEEDGRFHAVVSEQVARLEEVSTMAWDIKRLIGEKNGIDHDIATRISNISNTMRI